MVDVKGETLMERNEAIKSVILTINKGERLYS